MTTTRSGSPTPVGRDAVTAAVLAATERLSESGQPSSFTVRQIAEEAGVTPSLTIANRCTPPVSPAGRAKAAVQIIEHLRAKRSAEQSNVADFARDTAMPMVLIDDLPEPVTTLEGIRTLSRALGQAS